MSDSIIMLPKLDYTWFRCLFLLFFATSLRSAYPGANSGEEGRSKPSLFDRKCCRHNKISCAGWSPVISSEHGLLVGLTWAKLTQIWPLVPKIWLLLSPGSSESAQIIKAANTTYSRFFWLASTTVGLHFSSACDFPTYPGTCSVRSDSTNLLHAPGAGSTHRGVIVRIYGGLL